MCSVLCLLFLYNHAGWNASALRRKSACNFRSWRKARLSLCSWAAKVSTVGLLTPNCTSLIPESDELNTLDIPIPEINRLLGLIVFRLVECISFGKSLHPLWKTRLQASTQLLSNRMFEFF